MNKNSGHQHLHILILEDNPLDVKILLAELHKAGVQSSYVVVNTKEDYLRKLESQVDARQALALLKERSLDIPFIVISDTVGEDTAVAVMKSEKQYRLLIEAMNESVLQVDNDDVIVFANDQYCKTVRHFLE